jgi:hypothetical protein
MSSAPVTVDDADAGEVAAVLRDAPFVRVVAGADGDSLAASGVLARALDDANVPFQIRIDAVPTVGDGTDVDETVVGIGVTDADLSLSSRPASVAAFEAASELGSEPDPILALAGVVAAGAVPGDDGSAPLLDAANVERRPGIAGPTADPADALAHSTLVRVPVSGDTDTASETCTALGVTDDPDDEERRRLASWLAIAASETDEGTTSRAAASVERVLRPHATPDAPFATVEGLGDLLDAVARERAGIGVALALGVDTREAALSAWRSHARAVHAALSDATTGRYDGLYVARLDDEGPGRLATAARLCRDFHSPEPVALVVGEGGAAAASVEARTVGRALGSAVATVGGTSAGGKRHGTARFGDDAEIEVSEFIAAFREAL